MTDFSHWISQATEERARRKARGVVLLFHEVHDDDDRYTTEFRTGCTAAFLDAIVSGLRRRRWDIVPLDEAMSRLENDDTTRRFAVLTFDDGYRNTATRALPILERHGASFTIYVPTGAITRELPCWWLGLRQLFQYHDTVTVEAMAKTFECCDIPAKIAAYLDVKNWVKQDYRRAAGLTETFSAHGISLSAVNDSYFMDEAALQKLARHPLVSIGAHTQTHPALPLLGAIDAKKEIEQNKCYLEMLLNRPVSDFAYPFGIFGDREATLTATLGFRTAVTTEIDFVLRTHRKALHRLPRMEFSGTTARLERCFDVLG